MERGKDNRCYSIPVIILLCTLILGGCLLVRSSKAYAASESVHVPLKSLAQIKVDDDGKALGFPIAVFYDPVMEEIYAVNGDTKRVIVYGSDFFPNTSIGIGRGVVTPRGGEVLSNGDVYISQIPSGQKESPRITILNGAFFPKREILLDEIPEVKRFSPTYLAVNPYGIIYVTGINFRGVLVLDNEGNFLRLLQPTDEISLRAIREAEIQAEEEENVAELEQLLPTEEEEAPPEEENPFLDIPEEYRPRSEDDSSSLFGTGIGPIRINFVTLDSTGKIYMISAETGKVYVYGPDESFLFSFGQKGGSPRQQSQPRSLAIDEDRGLIYVVDYMRHTILTYDMSGEYLFEFGGRGVGPGWFNFPTAITINKSGQIIVADLFNRRIQVLEVGYDEISEYLEGFSIKTSPEEAAGNDLTGQEELTPGEPEGFTGEEDQPDSSLEEMDRIIKEEGSGNNPEEEVIPDEQTGNSPEDEIILEEQTGNSPEDEIILEEQTGNNPEEEVILEEEVIEESPPEPTTPGPFDEPLTTPE